MERSVSLACKGPEHLGQKALIAVNTARLRGMTRLHVLAAEMLSVARRNGAQPG
ncbi:MAG TPA: hypothetical protein VNA24_22705 [Hyalangium sp.]|nr:hypothetical protein [Hyalangium sp.]